MPGAKPEEHVKRRTKERKDRDHQAAPEVRRQTILKKQTRCYGKWNQKYG